LWAPSLPKIFAPQFVRWFVKGFTPDKIDFVRSPDTHSAARADIFLCRRRGFSGTSITSPFPFSGIGPLIYNLFIILGGVVGGRHFGIASLAYGALAGAFAGPFLASVIGAARIGTGYRPSFDIKNPAFREWVKLSVPLMLGYRSSPPTTGFCDTTLRRASRYHAAHVRQAPVRRANRSLGSGDRASLFAVFRPALQ